MHLSSSYVINMLQLNSSFKRFGVRYKYQKGKAKNKLILRHTPTALYVYTWIFQPSRTYKAVQTNVTLPKTYRFDFGISSS